VRGKSFAVNSTAKASWQRNLSDQDSKFNGVYLSITAFMPSGVPTNVIASLDVSFLAVLTVDKALFLLSDSKGSLIDIQIHNQGDSDRSCT
jgi:hypothetical protein